MLFHEGKTNTSLPGGCPLSHGVCWLALLLLRLEKNPRGEKKTRSARERGSKDYPWGVPPDGQERRMLLLLMLVSFTLEAFEDRWERGVWACEGLLQLGHSGEHSRRLQCTSTEGVLEESWVSQGTLWLEELFELNSTSAYLVLYQPRLHYQR